MHSSWGLRFRSLPVGLNTTKCTRGILRSSYDFRWGFAWPLNIALRTLSGSLRRKHTVAAVKVTVSMNSFLPIIAKSSNFNNGRHGPCHMKDSYVNGLK